MPPTLLKIVGGMAPSLQSGGASPPVSPMMLTPLNVRRRTCIDMNRGRA